MNSLIFVAIITRLCARSEATSVSTFDELSAAMMDGASIIVGDDITFTSALTLSSGMTVAITGSSSGSVLSGGGSTRLFYVNGSTLLLSSLTLTGGSASTSGCDNIGISDCYGGIAYVNAGYLSLDSCVLSDSTAYVRLRVAAGPP